MSKADIRQEKMLLHGRLCTYKYILITATSDHCMASVDKEYGYFERQKINFFKSASVLHQNDTK